MENPSIGSVLTGGPSGNNTGNQTDGSRNSSNNTKGHIAPGIPAGKETGLGRGAQRMELETWKDGVQALKQLLMAIERNESNPSSSATATATISANTALTTEKDQQADKNGTSGTDPSSLDANVTTMTKLESS